MVKNDEEPVPAIVLTRFAGLFENLASFPSGSAGRHALNQANTGDERGPRNWFVLKLASGNMQRLCRFRVPQ